MWGKLITFAITSGLAKKAWDHYRDGRRQPPEDITGVVARPEAAQPARKGGRKPRRREGPAA